jgi:uncharacterized membrane protein YkvA (DUF1232 family)
MKFIDTLKQKSRALKRDVMALWIAYRDPRTPCYARVFSAVVVAYALSPIDLIPDFVPVLGYLDDLILIPSGIALALKMIPAEVMAESRAKADEQAASGKPTNWIAAAVIILIWLVVLFFLARWLIPLIKKD